MKKSKILKYTLFIFCGIIIFSFISFVWEILHPSPTRINYDYNSAYKDIVYKKKISHFPKKIPLNAKNIKVYEYSNRLFGSEMFLLNFEIDENYINNEFKKHKFINQDDKIGSNQKIYYVPKVMDDFNIYEYTYYVLDTKENREHFPAIFPYINGIGIKNDKTAILYYYVLPED